MYLRFENGRINAYSSFKEKDRLRKVGFRWTSKLKAWGIKPTALKMQMFFSEFRQDSMQMDEGCKDLIKKAKSQVKARENKQATLQKLKEDLFRNPSLIDVTPYAIPKGITLYDHQKIALEYFYSSNSGNLYGDCGVGKTAIMLLLTERLIRENKVQKVLVVCPKSIMRAAWEEDAQKFTPNLSLCVLDKGTKLNKAILKKDFHSHPKLKKLYDNPYDIYVINYESLHGLKKDIPYYGFDLLILDEASKVKGHKTKVSKTCVELSKFFPRRYIMSGTPAPNSELEYFSQMNIVDPTLFGDSFFSFREDWFRSYGFMGFQFELLESLRTDFIKKLYTYGLRFKQKDCVDLPSRQYLELPSYMSQKLSKAYRTLQKEKVLEMQNSVVPVSNPLAELTKLRQLCSSHCKNEEGELVTFENHKIKTAEEFLESIPEEQVIIWAVFIHDIESLKELLGDKAGALYGKTSSSEMTRITQEFKAGKLQYIIANPKSVAHGHTWVNARVNLFYSLDYSSEAYEQACKRTHRIGQLEKVLYYHMMSRTDIGDKTIDSIIYAAVRGKLKNSYEVMDAFKELALG